VFEYFQSICDRDEENYTALLAISSFITAAHEQMLECLKKTKADHDFNMAELRSYWHKHMEPGDPVSQEFRKDFFKSVVSSARSASGVALVVAA
jgi:hypothetical protein